MVLLLVIVLGALIALGFGLYKVRATKDSRPHDYGKWDGGSVIGAMACTAVALTFLSFIVSMVVPPNETPFERHLPLKSIQDNSEIHGSFFLASGGFGEDMKYYYYVERNGAYRLETADPDDSVGVKEGPKAELIEKGVRKTHKSWVWPIMGDYDYVNDTVFVVPGGSIKQDYNLDAKK